MRIVFFGTSAFAVPSLEALVAAGHAVTACVTQPDRPRGRGLALEPSPVKQAAQQLGLTVLQPQRPAAAELSAASAEIGVLASYGQLIRRDVLDAPPHGILGVHPSLLPKYRGAAPVAWALLNGETRTGVTIYRLVEALDAGPIVTQREVPIEPGEDAAHLTDRLAALGAQELVRALALIGQGTASFVPQDERGATFAPKLTKAQGMIDWHQPAIAIERLVRGLTPWPGAVTRWQGLPLKVWAARAAGRPAGEAAPGTVVQVNAGDVQVATGDGLLAVLEVQLPGRRRAGMREFLAGHPMNAGDQFTHA
jgi:methionyl-tRNA formyltransferase